MQIPLAVIRGDDRHGFGVGYEARWAGPVKQGLQLKCPTSAKERLNRVPNIMHARGRAWPRALSSVVVRCLMCLTEI